MMLDLISTPAAKLSPQTTMIAHPAGASGPLTSDHHFFT
jgi:hypothetical protein